MRSLHLVKVTLSYSIADIVADISDMTLLEVIQDNGYVLQDIKNIANKYKCYMAYLIEATFNPDNVRVYICLTCIKHTELSKCLSEIMKL